jgi:hypothetical protein
VNPAALYIARSEAYIAAQVPFVGTPVPDARDAIMSAIWGITAHIDVFALHVSLRPLRDESQGPWRFTQEIADEVSIYIEYPDGASTIGGLGRRSEDNGASTALIESHVSDRRIDAHMAVSPLLGPGEVRILLAMGDGSKLGEWRLRGESILEASRMVISYDQA